MELRVTLAPIASGSPAAHCGIPDALDTGLVRRNLTFHEDYHILQGPDRSPGRVPPDDGVNPGQEFDVERLDRGDYRFVRRTVPPNEGGIDWLLACPYKNFFEPIDSASTDTL